MHTCDPDLQVQCRPWTNHRVRMGPRDGRAASVGPSAWSAAACPRERGVRGYHRPWDSSGCDSPAWLVLMEGVLPKDAFLRHVEGYGEQHAAGLAGREAQQLLHQQMPLLWGTRGSVGHSQPGHGMPVPNPPQRQWPALPSHSLGDPHLPAWSCWGQCPGRTGAGWAVPCGRAAAGVGGCSGAAAVPCGCSAGR